MLKRLIDVELIDYTYLTLAFICFLLVGIIVYYKIYKKDGNV